MKTIIGTCHRKEGKDRERLFTAIQCSECGHVIYERRSGRIQAALERDCQHCRPCKSDKRAHHQVQDGRGSHPLYRTYQGMIRRCYCPNDKAFVNYGARGIEVCLRWQVDFWAFVADMGERPDGCSIDRIDNDDNYSPLNCRWATHSEQMSNSRPPYALLTPEEIKAQTLARHRVKRNPTGRPVGRPRKHVK